MQVGSTAMTQAKLFYFFLFTFHIDNVHLFKYTNWCEYDSLKSWTMRVWNTAMTKAILLFMMMCTSYKCTKWQCEYHSQHVGFLSFLFLLWCIVRNSLNGYWTCKAHSMIHRPFFYNLLHHAHLFHNKFMWAEICALAAVSSDCILHRKCTESSCKMWLIKLCL